MKKTVYLLFLTILIVIAISSAIHNALVSKKEVQILKKVTVVLDWFPNTNHTGIYVAKHNGLFAEKGLEVQIIQPGETEAGQIVASGKADFGISSQESVTLARAKDVPIVSIATILQHNTSAFASKKETGITKVVDFEGKRYGGWGSPIEEATLKALMESAHAKYSKIKNVTIGTNDFFTNIGRESDFQWIFYGWDGIEAKRRGIDLNLIWLKDLDPVLDYYTPVIITNEKHITEQKELTRKFISAVAEGYKYAVTNPKESAEILIKEVPELNKELVLQSQDWISKEYMRDSEKWGVQEKPVWDRYTEWLDKHKLIEKNVESDSAFTNQFLP